MANYIDTYYEEVDALMRSLRPNPFETPLPDPLPQVEQPVGPVGWVENADGSDGEATVIINSDGITVLDGKITVVNGVDTLIEDGVVRYVENEGADVTIDADGITILNGAINLQDLGGQSVLSAAGFGGSWVNFIADRMYNSMFAYGTIDTDFSVSETGGADTEQEYKDSLSTELPYWVVGSATATARLISDTDATFGRALRISGAAGKLYIYQDVPVTPGNYYTMLMTWKYVNSASEFSRTFRLSWRDGTRALIGTEQEDSLGYTTSQAAYTQDPFGFWEAAPNNAAYLRVGFEIDQTSGSPTVTIADVKMYEASFYGEKFHMRTEAETAILNGMVIGESVPQYVLNASGTMQWGPGDGAIDTQIGRENPGVLEFSSAGGGGAIKIRGNSSVPAKILWGDTSNITLQYIGDDTLQLASPGVLRLATTSDASPSSTGHAFQIGSSTSTNLRMDNNEILAANDGSASALHLQNDSGDLVVGAAQSTPLIQLGADLSISRLTNPAMRFTVDGNPELELVTGGRLILANSGYFEMIERTAPGAPAANRGRLFLRDNGAGKTQLCVIFSSGAIQVIATQP